MNFYADDYLGNYEMPNSGEVHFPLLVRCSISTTNNEVWQSWNQLWNRNWMRNGWWIVKFFFFFFFFFYASGYQLAEHRIEERPAQNLGFAKLECRRCQFQGTVGISSFLACVEEEGEKNRGSLLSFELHTFCDTSTESWTKSHLLKKREW